jgi:hypothetical protein
MKPHKVRFSLDILHCVNCGKDITKDTFPHYCKDCISYLQKYSRLPEYNNTQDDFIEEEPGVLEGV